ncbi:MAG: hypothetical protein WAU47_12715 [Desulfobaccales bacterium]
MKRRLSCWSLSALCLAVLALCVPGSVWGVSIPINNPDFESDVLPVRNFIEGSFTGWTVTNNAAEGLGGVWHPIIGNPKPFYGYSSSVPGPFNVGIASGTTIFQTLSSTLEPNTIYTLQVYVGTWLTGQANYTVALLAGASDVLASVTGIAPFDAFSLVTLDYTSGGAGSSFLGNPLTIALSSGPIESNFDLVTLNGSEVPLPSTLLLVASGLGGLALMRRRFVL